MPDPCHVIIGAANVLTALKERAAHFGGESLAFPDSDAAGALHAITTRRPSVIALERLFAISPRGVALISRIKADPKLRPCQIRVLAHDSDYSRVIPRTPTGDDDGVEPFATRRARRFTMAPKTIATVAGKTATLVNLSTIGAQIVSTAKLSPNQRVPMSLVEPAGNVRFEATVAWTSFETPTNSGPRYRAGVEFIGADAAAVSAFCLRHRDRADV